MKIMIPPWTNRIRHPMQSLSFSNEIRDADRANLLLENSFAKGRFQVEIPITSHGGLTSESIAVCPEQMSVRLEPLISFACTNPYLSCHAHGLITRLSILFFNELFYLNLQKQKYYSHFEHSSHWLIKNL